jgi:hypothetical protein
LFKSHVDIIPGNYVVRMIARDSEGQMMSTQNSLVEIALWRTRLEYFAHVRRSGSRVGPTSLSRKVRNRKSLAPLETRVLPLREQWRYNKVGRSGFRVKLTLQMTGLESGPSALLPGETGPVGLSYCRL